MFHTYIVHTRLRDVLGERVRNEGVPTSRHWHINLGRCVGVEVLLYAVSLAQSLQLAILPLRRCSCLMADLGQLRLPGAFIGRPPEATAVPYTKRCVTAAAGLLHRATAILAADRQTSSRLRASRSCSA